MGVLRDTGKLRESERGFTLPEILVTIIILGILAGIAFPSFFSVVNGRAVDSATNHLVADLRLASTKSTTQLADWVVVSNPASLTAAGVGYSFAPSALPSGKDYYLIKLPSSTATQITSADITGRFLEEGNRAQIAPTTPLSLRFKPDGSITALNGTALSTVTITVRKNSASVPKHDIDVNPVTSRVQITS